MSTQIEALAKHASEAAALLKELSHEYRLMICCLLGQAELSVAELNAEVPLSQSALSQHLARLRKADLVSTRKEGLIVYYRLKGEATRNVINTLKTIYCP